MSDLSDVGARPPGRPPTRRFLAAAVLSTFIAVWPTVLGSSALISTALASSGPGAWLDLARNLGSFVALQSLSDLLTGPSAISTGSDGRLTILLLGSDTRGAGVARTDTVMLMSVRNGVVSAASIPRDTSRIPNPDGGTFSGRINGIVKLLTEGRTTAEALDKFEVVIEQLVQVEIDYYALVKFDGFNGLVEAIEPVTIKINREVHDSRYWDDPNQPSGVFFPADSAYDLFAWQPGGDSPLCNGLWRFQSAPIPPSYWCRRAMPYIRSRKGSSDFVRARRQQDFVIAAARRVLNRGAGSDLITLVNRAAGQRNAGQLITNIPLDAANALELYNLIDGASVGFQVVFSPSTYATHIPGTTAYFLNLSAVRQVGQQWFGGTGTAPPTPGPTPSGDPTASPSSGPTVAPTGSGPVASPTAGPTSGASATPTANPTSGSTAAPGTSPTAVTSGAPSSSPGGTSSPGPTGLQTPSPLPSSSAAPSGALPPTPSGALPPTPGGGSPGLGSPSVPPGLTPSPAPGGGTATGGGDVVAVMVVLAVIVVGAGVLAVGWTQLGWFRPR